MQLKAALPSFIIRQWKRLLYKKEDENVEYKSAFETEKQQKEIRLERHNNRN